MLSSLYKKSETTRRKIAFWGALFVGIAIFSIWLFTFAQRYMRSGDTVTIENGEEISSKNPLKLLKNIGKNFSESFKSFSNEVNIETLDLGGVFEQKNRNIDYIEEKTPSNVEEFQNFDDFSAPSFIEVVDVS